MSRIVQRLDATVHGPRGNIFVLVKLLFVLAPAAIAGTIAASAAAEPCIDCGGGGGGTIHHVYSHDLTVQLADGGRVVSNPAGIDCPGDCTLTESHSVDCDLADTCPGESDITWGQYTLTASAGPSGFAPSWSNCSPSGATCSVTLDADKTVTLTWNDVTNPTVALTSPAAGAAVGASMGVSASASDNDRVASVKFLVDDVLKATDTTAPYAATIDMSGYADGSSHSVAALATDDSGRLTEVTRTVTVDKHVNLTVGSLPAYANAQTVPLSISTESDATMQCRLNGGSATPCSGSYSPVSAATPDGVYTYAVVAIDAAGNTASATRSFVLDRTAPAVAITDGPTEGQAVTTSSATVTFTVTDVNLDSLTCAIDGVPGPCSSDHSMVLQGLPDGDHTLTIAATDKAGNASQRVRTFSVHTAAPAGGGTPTLQPPATLPPSTPVTSLAPHPPVRLVVRAKARRRVTQLRLLMLRGLPKGAVVRITCRGHGCPRKHFELRSARGGSMTIKALQRRRLRAGTRVSFRIVARGRPSQTLTLRIRKGRKPLTR
jgi:hypothetical protein